MSAPLNQALSFKFPVRKMSDGTRFRPSPDPTVDLALYPDGAAIAGVALTWDATNLEYTYTLASGNVTQTGPYRIAVLVTDAAAASMAYEAIEEVRAPEVQIWNYLLTAITTAGSVGKYIIDTLAAMLLKTNLIGTGTTTVTSPVGPDGTTLRFVRNDDYVVANGRQVDLTLPAGFPDMTGGQTLTLAYKKFDGTTGTLTGTAYTTRIMRFEFPSSVTSVLAPNASDYSVLEVISATRNTPYVGNIIVTDTRTSIL